MPTPKEELQEHLNKLYPDIASEMEVLSREEVFGGTLMHISKNPKIDSFKPFISHRVAEQTDKRVARICTGPTLTACFMGYIADHYDFEQGTAGEDEEFLGGWVVYGFDFDAAILPSIKLVSDVKETNEHWLVSYNEKTAEYKPKKLGKIFHTQVTSRRFEQEGFQPTMRRDITSFIEVFDGCEMPWDHVRVLKPGFYRIFTQGLLHSQAWNLPNPHSVEDLSPEEYQKAKSLTASLLGLQEKLPSWKW